MIKFRSFVAIVAILLVTAAASAWPGGRGGSSSSRSSSSGSRSSSSFRPSSGSGSKSTPAFRPSSGPSGSTPKVTSNQPGHRSSQATARRDSAVSYQASKPVVKTPSGTSKPIPERHIASTPPNASSTRVTRVTNLYRTTHYGSWTPHPYQHDSFHPMLTGYLLGRLSSPQHYGPTRDWVYLHYDSMDPTRRDELFRENAQLRSDVEALRASKAVVQEPTLDIDADLLYDDDVAATIYRHNRGGFWIHMWHFFLICCCCVMLILAIGYVFFYKDWS